MKKVIGVAAVAVVLAFCSAPLGFACGQKFLVMNRNVSKAQCFMTAKTGSILIYRHSGGEAAVKALGVDLERTLSAVGHRVKVADSPEALGNAIKGEAFDMILAGYAISPEVEKALSEAGKNAKIVPVVDKENKVEVKTAKERYGSVIKTSDRTSTKVLTVNEVLSAKENNAVSGI